MPSLPNRKPLHVLLATVYPLGYIPYAPGTWGSLPGLLVGSLIYYISISLSASLVVQWMIASGVLFGLGVVSYFIIKASEITLASHDDKRIVIDEVIGQAIPVAFFSLNLWQLLVCFLLFRFFDILKPGPIGWADRKLEGAVGTLLDDVIAGFFCLGLVTLDHYFVGWLF